MANSSRSGSVRKLANTSRLPCEASDSSVERPRRGSRLSRTQYGLNCHDCASPEGATRVTVSASCVRSTVS